MTGLEDVASVEAAVRQAVAEATITDIHTHLFPPSHGDLLLWNVDELLTYHYLVAELFTVAPREVTPDRFWRLAKREQADLIWEHLFVRHGPLSEATRGVLTTLSTLGLDIGSRDLHAIRQWFDARTIEEYLPRVFEIANLDYAVMTNNPFIAEETRYWTQDLPIPDCLKAALRIDTLILDWPTAAKAMTVAGYDAGAEPDAKSVASARAFLADWAERMQPVYMAASLPADFAYPSAALSSTVLREVALPAAAELNLCQENPDAKFLVTVLSRVNQHEMCVLARKFGNLHLFGCWWFCNNPSIIEEMTRMRLELLGTAFTCQHSDARVLDQLIYKWSHTRAVVAEVLVEKYRLQFAAGWRPTDADVRRDARALLGGSFAEFLAK